MNADTRDQKRDVKKEGRKDDSKKSDAKDDAGDDDGAARAISAIAGAIARSGDSGGGTAALEPDLDEPRRPRTSLGGGPADAAAHALSAIARKHAVVSDSPTAPPVAPMRGAGGGGNIKRRPLYDRLVETEDDLVGLIAYALYKQHKRDWLAAFNAEAGRMPRDEEINAFLLGEGTEKQLRAYRDQSVTVLRAYADSVVADARPQILVEAIEGRIKSSLRWWKLVPAGIAGALIVFAVILAMIYLLPAIGIDPGFRLSLSAA